MRKTLKKKYIKQFKGGSNQQDIPYIIGERMTDVVANPMGLAKNIFKIYSMPVNPRFWKGVVQVGQHIVNTPISFSLSSNPMGPNLNNISTITNKQISSAKEKIKNARLQSTTATVNALNRMSRRITSGSNKSKTRRRR